MEKFKSSKNTLSNIKVKGGTPMTTKLEYDRSDSPDSKILVALSDINRECILRIIASDRNMDIEKIKEHIEIDNVFLEDSIDILKDANLISNNKIPIEPEGYRRIFNITSLGKDVLTKLK